MESLGSGFLSENRLMFGPWQAFERDIARLMMAHNFNDVRLIGGSGDHGGDILAIKEGEVWVVQCKHTTTSAPTRQAISEVVSAAQHYNADRMLIAVSRPLNDPFLAELDRYERLGLKVDVLEPTNLKNFMESALEYSPTKKTLREYQSSVASKFRDALIDTGRAQVIMATGLGKTIVMADVVDSLYQDNRLKNGRVLLLAHTNPIVKQLHYNFWHQLPKWIHTHQLCDGEQPSDWEGITFATVQSAIARQASLPIFDLVLVDEAHHVGAATFRETIDFLKPPMLGGMTATPWRGDGFDIDEILGPPIARLGIAEGLRQGFLSEVDYRLLADNIDWQMVRDISKHQYSLNQLNRRLILPTRDEKAVAYIKKIFREEDRQSAIVFSPSIDHAEHFAKMLRRFNFRAQALNSHQPPRDQGRILLDFQSGNIQVVTTVDMFNEGVDVPDVDLLIFMRATHSRRIFVQQLGRGLRLSPGKDRVVVLDFVSDLRRLQEVLHLDRLTRENRIEHLGLGKRLIEFEDKSAGKFLYEWVLDQASLESNLGESRLDSPKFDFPEPPPPGGIQ
jgi:superfamily II DNA or RNA helicase